jgi:hypothetical protein
MIAMSVVQLLLGPFMLFHFLEKAIHVDSPRGFYRAVLVPRVIAGCGGIAFGRDGRG